MGIAKPPERLVVALSSRRETDPEGPQRVGHDPFAKPSATTGICAIRPSAATCLDNETPTIEVASRCLAEALELRTRWWDCLHLHHQPVFALTSAVVRDRTLILVITSAFARVGARSIPELHRGDPGFVILADQ